MATDPKKLEQAKAILDKINAIYRELGKKQIKFDNKNAEEYKSILSEARSELSDMEGSATNLYEQLRGVSAEIGGQKTNLAIARKGFRDITKAADDLLKDEQEIAKLDLKQLKTLRQKAEIAKKDVALGVQALKDESSAYQQILRTVKAYEDQGKSLAEVTAFKNELVRTSTALTDEEKALIASQEDGNRVIDEIINKAQERLDLEQKIEDQAAAYTKTAKFMTSLPGLKAFAGPFQNAAEAVKKMSREAKGAAGSLEMAGAAAKEIGKSVLLQGVAISGVFTFLKKAVFSVNAKQVEISKNLGLGEERARGVYNQFKAISKSAGDTLQTTKNLINANMQLGNIFGTMSGFSEDQLKTQVDLTKKIGLQEDSAANLASLSMASGQSTSDTLKGINEQNAAFKLQTGIVMSSKELLDSVSKVSGQLSANYKNDPTLIAKAVQQTRKLGLSLSQAKNMSSSLLNFEESIAAEMEAEMLLGRNLNLDRARSLALQGKHAEAAEEIANQFGTAEEFAALTVIEQNALAKAAGTTADELANSLIQRENLEKLGNKEKEILMDQVNALKAKGKVEEANRLLSVAGNAEELAAAQQRLSFEDRINAAKDYAIEKLMEMLTANGGIEAIVERVVGFFEALPNHLGFIKNLLVGMIGLMTAFKVASIAAGIAQAAIAAGATMTASAVSAGIAIPAIIAGAALAYGAYKMMSMDAPKPKNDVAIPAGYGNNMISGPKGSIALNNKDSIIAGTNLFGGNKDNSRENKLLEKIDHLIHAVEKGGNVYLDGSKVGRTLKLSERILS